MAICRRLQRSRYLQGVLGDVDIVQAQKDGVTTSMPNVRKNEVARGLRRGLRFRRHSLKAACDEVAVPLRL
jgi:hypothetical protein